MISHSLRHTLLATVISLACAQAQITINPPSTGSGVVGGGGTLADTVTAPTTYGAASNPGSASTYSRGDHTHGTPAVPTAAQVGAVATSGNETVNGIKAFSSSPTVPSPTTGTQAANKSYVDSAIAGLAWKDPVLDASLSTDAGLSPTTGNRYIVSGTGSGGWTGHNNAIAVYDTDHWVFTAATTGFAVLDTTHSKAYNYNGTAWVQFSATESGTASLGVQKVGSDYRADFTADKGLKLNGNALEVDYDGVTLDMVGGVLKVVDGSLTEAKMAALPGGILNDVGRVSGLALTALQAIPSGAGVIPSANLGTGTTDATTYLAGDGTFRTCSVGVGAGAVTTSAVLRAMDNTSSSFNLPTSGYPISGVLSGGSKYLDLSNATYYRLRVNSAKASGSTALTVTYKVYYATTATPPSLLSSWTLLEKGGTATGNVVHNQQNTSIHSGLGASAAIADGAKTTVWLSVWGFSSSGTASVAVFAADIEFLQGTGQGDVTGPATTTQYKVPQWDATQKKLTDGLAVGTSAYNLVQLDAGSKLPEVDGSQLTGIFPAQLGKQGTFLTTSGSALSWAADGDQTVCFVDRASAKAATDDGKVVQLRLTEGTTTFSSPTVQFYNTYHKASWKFSDGAAATDTNGVFTLTGATSEEGGKSGYSLSHVATNAQYPEVGASLAWSFWVKLTNNWRNCILVSKDLNANSATSGIMYIRFRGFQNGDNKNSFSMNMIRDDNSETVTAKYELSGSLQENAWYHIVGVYDNGYLGIYVNGGASSFVALNSTLKGNAAGIWMGNANQNNERISIDEFNTWERSGASIWANSTERSAFISALFAAGLGDFYATQNLHYYGLGPDVGTAANNLVQLDGNGKLPAVDGSQLINLPADSTTPVALTFANPLAPAVSGGKYRKTTATSAFELDPPTGGAEGDRLELWITCDGTGRAMTLDAAIAIPSDSGFTSPKTLTASKTYIIVLKYSGSAWWFTSCVGGF